MNITENELIKAIQDAMTSTPDNPSGAMTTSDLVDAMGIGERKVLRLMKELKAAGVVEVTRVYRENIFGVVRQYNAFVLKQK